MITLRPHEQGPLHGLTRRFIPLWPHGPRIEPGSAAAKRRYGPGPLTARGPTMDDVANGRRFGGRLQTPAPAGPPPSRNAHALVGRLATSWSVKTRGYVNCRDACGGRMFPACLWVDGDAQALRPRDSPPDSVARCGPASSALGDSRLPTVHHLGPRGRTCYSSLVILQGTRWPPRCEELWSPRPPGCIGGVSSLDRHRTYQYGPHPTRVVAELPGGLEARILGLRWLRLPGGQMGGYGACSDKQYPISVCFAVGQGRASGEAGPLSKRCDQTGSRREGWTRGC